MPCWARAASHRPVDSPAAPPPALSSDGRKVLLSKDCPLSAVFGAHTRQNNAQIRRQAKGLPRGRCHRRRRRGRGQGRHDEGHGAVRRLLCKAGASACRGARGDGDDTEVTHLNTCNHRPNVHRRELWAMVMSPRPITTRGQANKPRDRTEMQMTSTNQPTATCMTVSLSPPPAEESLPVMCSELLLLNRQRS